MRWSEKRPFALDQGQSGLMCSMFIPAFWGMARAPLPPPTAHRCFRRMTQSQSHYLQYTRATRLDVATHEKPFCLWVWMHGRMHFNHEGYSVTSEKGNEKIKTIPRETPRLPATSAPASRMTYCMQVIFSIDFYSLLITSCCYGGRKHWTISQFTGVCLMPQRRRWITRLNFQYIAFVQHETLYVSSEREWSLREGKKKMWFEKTNEFKKKKKTEIFQTINTQSREKSVNELGYGGCGAHAEC